MSFLIFIAVVLPLVFCSALVLVPHLSEQKVALITQSGIWLNLLIFAGLLVVWSLGSGRANEYQIFTLYERGDYSFPVVFYLDLASLVYLGLSAVLASLTAKYSRFYLHRESGYRRFFALIFLMLAGANLLSLAGTLDLLFAGWELIGLSSFLLISFYWQRTQPAQNAFLAFSVYRVCDAGLLGATILTHLLWKDGHHFASLAVNASKVLEHSSSRHPGALPVIAVLLLFAALGKSAQFPFSNWLPRAMEGPTPSSAIFYGALSIHAGVFLLLRTESIWSHYVGMQILIGAIGLISAVLGSMIGRTLSNIKGQIAYAGITQVGVIFVEVALGLKWIALAHLVLHSFLRAYQLLISPSVVAHALRLISSQDQSFAGGLMHRASIVPLSWLRRHEVILYRMTLTEFFTWPSNAALMGPLRWRSIWAALKSPFLPGIAAAATLIVVSLLWLMEEQQRASAELHRYLPFVIWLLALLFSVRAQLSSQTAKSAWKSMGAALVLSFLSAFILEPGTAPSAILPYFLTAALSWALGAFSLSHSGDVMLTQFHGRMAGSRGRGYFMLVSLMGIAGLPLAPSFLGEDLLLHWVFAHSAPLAAAITLSLVLVSIAAAKVFSRVFLGNLNSGGHAT